MEKVEVSGIRLGGGNDWRLPPRGIVGADLARKGRADSGAKEEFFPGDSRGESGVRRNRPALRYIARARESVGAGGAVGAWVGVSDSRGVVEGSGRYPKKWCADRDANNLRYFCFPGHCEIGRQISFGVGRIGVDTPSEGPYTPAHTDGGDAAADGGPVRP